MSSARDSGDKSGREGGRDGTSTLPPDTGSPAHGAWRLSGPPTPRDHPGWARPRRPWCLHTSPGLGLLPPSRPPPAPVASEEGERAQGPGVPQNFLQVHSCTSRPSSAQLPRARKARARPGHSRPGYIRSRGGGPRPGPKGGARGAPRLASCIARATRRVPGAAPAAGGWRPGAPCPAPVCTPHLPPTCLRHPQDGRAAPAFLSPPALLAP